ncbi:MAG TPA: hypothetical protein VF432_33085 [Thermoanaerobaculia bacterium]
MCVIRVLFLAALLAFLSAARVSEKTDQGSAIDPNGGVAKAEAGARIDDNGVQ